MNIERLAAMEAIEFKATLKELNIENKVSIYDAAKSAYHSGEKESPLSDYFFDLLEESILREDPTNASVQHIGTAVQGTVTLPYVMGSLNKIRPGGDLNSWLKQVDAPRIVITKKLDGLSCQSIYRNGRLVESYTRGDGSSGLPILRHISKILDVPKILTHPVSIAVRHEIYLKESVFQEKYQSIYKNARNMVAGAINRKFASVDILRDFSSEFYHIFDSPLGKEDQLLYLTQLGFPTVSHRMFLNDGSITDNLLHELLESEKKNSSVMIDGLVLDVDHPTKREVLGYETNSINPVFARAYKTLEFEDQKIATIEEVEYRVSKDGYLKPRCILQPIELCGVTVTHCTVFNAKYVIENKLGPGAQVLITRSGDVIPYVVEIVKPADHPQLPDESFGAYDWNDSGVDLVLKEESAAQRIEKLIYFFGTIGTEDFSGGLIERFYNHGHDTVKKILSLTEPEMLTIEGIKEKSAFNIRKAIKESCTDMYLPTLMKASGCFGRNFGESRSETIYKLYGDAILTWPLSKSSTEISETIQAIKGFSLITADAFANGLSGFISFLEEIKPYCTLAKAEDLKSTGELDGQIFVFTGFRSSELQESIESKGGKIGGSITSKTTYLVCKDSSKVTEKTESACRLGCKIISKGELEALVKSLQRGE